MVGKMKMALNEVLTTIQKPLLVVS